MRLRDSRVVRTSIALLRRWKSDELVDVSAGITYWTVLSVFPALLAFTAMLGWLGFFIGEDNAENVRRHVIEFVDDHLGTTGGPVATTVIDILSTPRGGVAALAFLIAVWSMSKGFAGLFRGLARIAGHPGRRSNMVGRAVAIAFGLCTVLLLLVLLLSVVVGPLLGFEHLLPNDGGILVTVWSYVRWPFITGAVITWLAVLLSVGPGTGLRWRRALPGAAFAAVAWVVVTIGFGLYFRFSGGANPVFGVLGGIIVALTWLHFLIIALLVGGMLNDMRWNAPPPDRAKIAP
jgi:membrane protein